MRQWQEYFTSVSSLISSNEGPDKADNRQARLATAMKNGDMILFRRRGVWIQTFFCKFMFVREHDIVSYKPFSALRSIWFNR